MHETSMYSYVRGVLVNYLDKWKRNIPLEDSRFHCQRPFVKQPKTKQHPTEQRHPPKSVLSIPYPSHRRIDRHGPRVAERLSNPTSVVQQDHANSSELSDVAPQMSVG